MRPPDPKGMAPIPRSGPASVPATSGRAPAFAQADLFAPAEPSALPERAARGHARRGPSPVRPAFPAPAARPLDEEAMARHLEADGRFRVLRRLEPRPVVDSAAPRQGRWRLGIVLDTETTGLEPSRDEVIELGMVAFLFDETGIGDVVGQFGGLREPVVPIGPEITRITGITPEMVAGHRLDLDAVARFVAPADLVIAHNARFDRPFCERLHPAFAAKAWACSVAEVDWAGLGFEGAKLGYLVNGSGLFHNGHRAVDDCHALLEVLARRTPRDAPPPFLQLLASAGRRRCRIFAEGSPFHTKDVLKARGYRWSDGTGGDPKSWWRDVEEADHEAEMRFLRDEIYGPRMTVEPHVRWMTACDRYRS